MTTTFCGIPVKSRFFLAPMAKVTALPFRLMCVKQGAGLVITEQINATQIARNPDPFTNNEFFTIKTVPEEKPVGVQLFGTEEKDFISAVEIVEKNFDLLNVNCGCPAPRETSIGAGAALLKNPDKIVSILKAIKSVSTKPVTAKIRLGWHSNDSLKIVRKIEKTECDAIMVHGRTASQKYMGKADWKAIRKIAESTSIPIIANGDVNSGETGMQLLEETKCEFGMIGRSAMNNPFVFREINEFEKGNDWKPSAEEKIEGFFDYFEQCKKFDMIKISDLKAKAIQFTKGIEFSKQTRVKLIEAKNEKEIIKALAGFEKTII
ncbi:MAG: tRNA-dihydrouridine synthase family protein [archaeon]|nr:tRNA-dihydrouridine synthase family protein [archaeon]